MRSEVAQMVAVLLCFARSARSDTIGSKLSNDHPTILVEKIRRQLMNENYDYMPSDSEATTLTPLDDEQNHGAIYLDSDINDQFITGTNDNKDDLNDHGSHAISNTDLLYYLDDDRLKHEEEKSDDNTTTAAVEATTPKVKYKILKVKQAHPNRRSQSFRRFIQEEGDEGVAIINLDDEPFPEFRLPRGRRQYMTEPGPGDMDSGLEVAPPSGTDEPSHAARTLRSARSDDNKDYKLVDLIKRNLRSNNDDYVDKFNNTKVREVALNKQSGADNVAKTNVKEQRGDSVSLKNPNHMNLEKNGNRRNADFSDQIDYNKYSFSPVTVTSNPSAAVPTIIPKRYQKVKADEGSPNYVKKGKSGEFKQFIDKNKALIQDFINNKKREEKETTERMPALRANMGDDGDRIIVPSDTELHKSKSSEERRGVIPVPKQLDMSPAKGGRIHTMRLKGRLCQRHVLVPEGPKYDSKGREYLRAFARGARSYAHTRAPRVLLPRCCNCCRKSVLGCE